MKTQKQHHKTYSIEFFPPKTPEGTEKLFKAHQQLAALKPRFFSVTFGAGGSTRDRTLDTVLEIKRRGNEAAPHISCIASSKTEIDELLNTYKDAGITHLVALRGDIPEGSYNKGEFSYANELVSYIRKTTGDHFHIEVAAYPEFHPQSSNANTDLKNFVEKIKCGANSAITQYFYNADSYFHFIEQCERADITIPIVPGIMPITNYVRLVRFSDACGAEIPRWIRKKLEAYEDDITSLQDFGTDVISRLCEQLLSAGAPGLHFYSMNQAEPTTTIWKNLNISI